MLSAKRLQRYLKRMAKPHPFFLCWWLLLFPLAGEAATAYNQRVASAYEETIKLKISNGRNLLKQELQENPSNAAALLVANYQDFLVLAVQQNPAHYEQLVAAQEKRLAQLAAIKTPSSPWVQYGLAEIRLQLAVSKLLFDNKLAAAWDFRKAFLQYEANAKKYPSFLPNKKSLGLLQALIGSVPDQYKWLLNIIGMKGDVRKGMSNLQAAATGNNPFQEEAFLLRLFLEQLIGSQDNAAVRTSVTDLTKRHPDNLLYTFVAMHLLKKTKQGDLALQQYLNRPTGKSYVSFPYLHYMISEIYLAKGNYEQSAQVNRLFLSQHQGLNHLKAANLKLYLAYWLNDQEQQARWHYNNIRKVGKTAVDEDNYAARFVKEMLPPQRELLVARLRSDGGYYREALQALNDFTIDNSTPHPDKVEYLYRKARIHHGLEDLPQAKKFYGYTINAAGTSNLYFAPNAALQLGYIYQEEKNTEKARTYFQAALAYKDHAYKAGIDSKAKLALSAL